ncbi:MAG: helical backbone metal receptor [Draconibacterium sp.]
MRFVKELFLLNNNVLVISTKQEEKSVSMKEISQSCLLLNDINSKYVISNLWIKVRNRSLILLFLLIITFSGFSQKINRVISLAPSVTENIYLIGEQKKLVGCTSYCSLALADGVEQVGSTVDVNIEKILSLQPDLVLTMLMTKSQDIEAMRKLGINVEVLQTPVNFSEICEQTLHIAELLGNRGQAEKIIERTKEQVESLKQVSLKSEKREFFFQIGANPIFTVLPNTFMNDFILFCNGENIAGEMKRGTMTRESVLLKNPDVIIIATMGGFGKEEMTKWKSYEGLKAIEKGKIFLVDSETSCSPTPNNFLQAFTDIVNFLNR